MLTIFFITLISISLITILVIIIRKLPQISTLDLSELEQEKTQKKKKEIIMRKVEQQSGQAKDKIVKIIKPVFKLWGQLQLKFRIHVGKVRDLWQHEQVVKTKDKIEKNPEEKEDKLSELIREGERNLEEGNLEKAENSFISAISLDSKSASAYRGLGDTYLAKQEMEEARQTYLFLTRLEPDDDTVWVKLAEIAESQGDLEEAIGHYQKAALLNESLSPRFYHMAELLIKVDQPETAKEAITHAVQVEPQNPKYLDLLIETAIICGDKDLALDGLEKLRMVNPDNNKLDSFRERIFQVGK